MKPHVFLSLLLASVSLCAYADDPGTPAETKAPRRRMVLPPEAFTQPTNHLLVVNLDSAVDMNWLTNQCQYMQRQLMVNVQALDRKLAETETLGDLRGLVSSIRKEDPLAPMVLLLAKGSDLAPIMASPYEYWACMDAGWVEAGGGEPALIQDRMGKRLFQTLGFCIGAGNRMEREAVMRFTPTPAALDDALSHGFHPLNSNVFSVVAQGIGLETIRLRPRKELLEMGILKPRTNAVPATVEKP